jgi:hypothetical protein
MQDSCFYHANTQCHCSRCENWDCPSYVDTQVEGSKVDASDEFSSTGVRWVTNSYSCTLYGMYPPGRSKSISDYLHFLFLTLVSYHSQHRTSYNYVLPTHFEVDVSPSVLK